MTTSASTDDSRAQLREWMKRHHLNQSRLAQLAGLNRSIIFRFLDKKQPLSQESAGKLYHVITTNADVIERTEWIMRLGLDEVAESLGFLPVDNYVGNPVDREPKPNQLQEGFSLIHQSVQAGRDLHSAIRYLERAENAFGCTSNMAAIAATKQASCRIELGDYEAVSRDIVRIDQTYNGVMDVRTRMRFDLIQAQLEYVCNNYAHAISLFARLLRKTLDYDVQLSANHFAGLCFSGLAETTKEMPAAIRYFDMAERYLLTSLRGRLMHNPDHEQLAYDHIRLSQVYRRMGKHREAQYHLTQALGLCSSEEPRLYIELENATVALADGRPKTARGRAEYCLERWSALWEPYGYPLGMAYALAIMAQAHTGARCKRMALAESIAAAVLAPPDSHYAGKKLAYLPGHIARRLQEEAGERTYKHYLSTLHEEVANHSGIFTNLVRVVPDRTQVALRLLDSL